MSDNNSQIDGMNRRKFMKTSSMAGFSAIGINGLDARSERLGQIEYVEVGLQYEIDASVESDGFYLPYIHVDENVGHIVDKNKRRLYLLEPTPDEAVETCKQNSAVVHSDGFRPIPTTVPGRKSAKQVPIDLGNNYRTTRALRTTHLHHTPEMTLSIADREVTLSSDDSDTRAVTEQDQRLSLPPVELTVELTRPTDEKVDRPDIPEYKRAVKVLKRTETLRATPEFHIKNYGTLEVIDATHTRVVNTT